jgi:hypothetical protein
MSLLVIPERMPDEGPCSFRFRLAASNLLSVLELEELEISADIDPTHTEASGCTVLDSGAFTPWVRRWSRFCPQCLASRQCWLMGWEVLFADACAECGCWLVDTCGACGGQISWKRDHLLRCICGKRLTDEQACAAPASVVRMSRALQCVALGLVSVNIPAFCGLSLGQCVRLIRLLGTYGNGHACSVPQKVLNVDMLSVSWPITAMAAEVLSTWPTGFNALLKTLQSQGGSNSSGKLAKAFGGFYFALYRGFKEDGFHFLRTAFEDYVAEHWTGGIAKRNRRLDGSVMEKLTWIPANHACRKLGVSRRRLMDLMQEGRLRGEMRVTAEQRQFIVVHKSDVQALTLNLDDGLPLEATAVRLGFSKQRLLGLLPVICPEARKLGVQGCPWSIPTDWVESWEKLIRSVAPVSDPPPATVAMGHVLRYWPWTDEQIGTLLVEIHNRTFAISARLSCATGLGSLLMDIDQLRAWFSARFSKAPNELTLPQVAIRIGVKQEVIYSLVRSGFLKATLRKSGRRSEQRVTFDSLAAFEEKYVFGRDVARWLNHSPRSILKFLDSENVHPVAGPGIDGCRQLLFERHAVARTLDSFPRTVRISMP